MYEEAEWEYACRAGTQSLYYWGEDNSVANSFMWTVANTRDVQQEHASPVGMKIPNAWGLYDMLGNVQEWVLDRASKNAYPNSGEIVDPVVGEGELQFLRGAIGRGRLSPLVALPEVLVIATNTTATSAFGLLRSLNRWSVHNIRSDRPDAGCADMIGGPVSR